MLEAILLAILLSVVFVMVLAGVLFGVFSWQLARSNRVIPDAPTTAPILWLWSPTQPARLHRRLRGAVRPLPLPASGRRGRGDTAPAGPQVELMQTVASQAVAVDLELVRVSRLSRPQRRRHMHSLTPQIVEIERLSLRLAHQHRAVTAPASIGGPYATAAATPQVLADVRTRLDRLDEAHDELLAIERDNGLLDPDEILRRAPSMPAVAPAEVRRGAASPPAAPPPTARPAPAPAPAPRRASST